MPTELPRLTVADAAAWRDWLLDNHADSSGVWLMLAKKDVASATTVTYDLALDEALCFGWIDGQVKGIDAANYVQRFTPRRSRSQWSRRNVGIIDRLTEAGRMHPAGLAEVEKARADGRWDAAYAGPAQIEIPADLAAALRAEPRAQQMFEILTSQNRFAVLHRLQSAKRPDTRTRRIEQFVTMLARGETVYPQRRQLGD